MAEKSYECLGKVKLAKDKEFAPGDPITGSKADMESLLLSGAVGEKGSFKKLQAEEEVKSVGDPEAVKKLIQDLKNEIVDQKVEIQKLLERNAELGKKANSGK